MTGERSLMRVGDILNELDELGFFSRRSIFDSPFSMERSLRSLKDTDKMFEEMNRSLKKAFENAYSTPETNIEETNDSYILSMKMPGVKKEDIKMKATEGMLELKVESEKESKTEEEKDKKKYIRYEFGINRVHQYIPLPKNTPLEKIASEYKDGILKLTIPKIEKVLEEKEQKYLDIKIN